MTEAASKAEIARVDLAHRRADEAVQQLKDGHIITSCDVLYEEENNGVRATWTMSELENWSESKSELVKQMKHGSNARQRDFVSRQPRRHVQRKHRRSGRLPRSLDVSRTTGPHHVPRLGGVPVRAPEARPVRWQP